MKLLSAMAICLALLMSGCAGEMKYDSKAMESREYSTLEAIQEYVPDSDLYVSKRLDDGAYFEISGLKAEEETARENTEISEALRFRLGSFGVFLTPRRYDYIFADSEYYDLPITLSHYGNLDLLLLHYPGYRGTNNGDLYVFEDSLFKGRIIGVGEVNFNDCYRASENNLWLVTTRHGGGSGLSTRHKEWINLKKDQLPTELLYADYYSTINFSFQNNLDFNVHFIYEAAEEALLLDEQDVPHLKINWLKSIYDSDKIITLNDDGTEIYPLQEPNLWGSYHPYAPINSDFVNGLEEQLDAYINNGTENQKHIARQIVYNLGDKHN